MTVNDGRENMRQPELLKPALIAFFAVGGINNLSFSQIYLNNC